MRLLGALLAGAFASAAMGILMIPIAGVMIFAFLSDSWEVFGFWIVGCVGLAVAASTASALLTWKERNTKPGRRAAALTALGLGLTLGLFAWATFRDWPGFMLGVSLLCGVAGAGLWAGKMEVAGIRVVAQVLWTFPLFVLMWDFSRGGFPALLAFLLGAAATIYVWAEVD